MGNLKLFGLPDISNNGIVFKTIPEFSIRYTIDLILQPDGKIVAPGSKVVLPDGTSTLIYFRYLPDGSPDPEFGTNGISEIDLGYLNQNASYLELLPDGKILGAGTVFSGGDGYENLIVRLNPDGTLDDTFGDGGSTLFNYGSPNQSVTDLEVTADGRILVAGYVEDVNGNAELNFAIARFNSDGSLDESFGDDGYRILDWGNSSNWGYTIDIQPDGKILFAGVKNDIFRKLLIFRLNEDGSTDSDFGVNGAVVIDDDEVTIPSIAVQSNGTALISGQGNTHVSEDKPAFYIARMLLDLDVGTLESSTTNSELLFYPNPIKDHTVLEYELLKDQDVEATIYTSDGTLVGICLPKSRQTAGKHQAPLQIAPGLKAGNYLLKITTDDVVKTVKFIKI